MHTFTHVLGHFASAVVIHFLLPSGLPRLDLEINNTCLGGLNSLMAANHLCGHVDGPNFHVDMLSWISKYGQYD